MEALQAARGYNYWCFFLQTCLFLSIKHSSIACQVGHGQGSASELLGRQKCRARTFMASTTHFLAMLVHDVMGSARLHAHDAKGLRILRPEWAIHCAAFEAWPAACQVLSNTAEGACDLSIWSDFSARLCKCCGAAGSLQQGGVAGHGLLASRHV